jgi:hypothetical protein
MASPKIGVAQAREYQMATLGFLAVGLPLHPSGEELVISSDEHCNIACGD